DSGGNARRERGPRRAPGDRPSQRGNPPRGEGGAPAPAVRKAPLDRPETEEETAAREIVRELLDKIGYEAEIYVTENPSTVPLSEDELPAIFIDVLGQDVGFVIGRRGDHLAQRQYIVNLLSNKRIGDWTRV